MIGVTDTSSLIAIARYYLSIKDEAILLRFLESKFRDGNLVLLGTIHKETKNTQKGIALSLMAFLNDTSLIIDDANLVPPSPKKFYNQLDNNFSLPLLKRRLNTEEYEQHKLEYLKTGDAKLILYALNHKDSDPVIITEETPYSNDNKLFKKIPSICDELNIKHMTIAEWLSENGVRLTWEHP